MSMTYKTGCETEMIKIFTDGLCQPVNPGGTACFGWVSYGADTRLQDGYGVAATGPEATNNVAEYRAIIEALKWALQKDYRDVQVFSDSQLAIRQLNGVYSVGAPRIIPLFDQVIALKMQFREITFTWIPGEANEEADHLSKVAYLNYIKNLAELETLIDLIAAQQKVCAYSKSRR